MNTPPRAADPREAERLRAETQKRRQRRIYRAATAALLALLGGALALVWMVRLHPERFEALGSEDLLLYSLTSLNVILIAALLFILFRNVVKVVVERKRGVLGAHFRAKLVWAFLLIAVVPSLGLFWVARDLIGKNVDSIFNPPMESLLSNAFSIAESYYDHVKVDALADAERLALGAAPAMERGDAAALSLAATAAIAASEEERLATFLGPNGAVLAQSAKGARTPSLDAHDVGKLERGENVTRWNVPERDRLAVFVPVRGEDGEFLGALALETSVGRDVAARATLIGEQYETYRQFNLRKRTIKESRVWTYGTVYLLIVFSASWLGLYLARVITKPIEALLEGTHAVSTGDLSYRVEVEATDELGLLVRSFNKMTEDLAASREALDSSRASLEEASREIESRRRNIAAILESIPTGVISLDPEGRVISANPAARRMLGLDASEALDESAENLFRRAGARELWNALAEYHAAPAAMFRRDLTLALPAGTRHAALSIVAAVSAEGGKGNIILVLEDVTELSRVQKMAAWQEVAQRMAHEVKNPLTPIRLSAQRILKNAGRRDAEYEGIVRECVDTIVTEVNALKNMVDEFSRFARLPALKPVSMDLEECIDAALALYDGHYDGLRFEKLVEPGLPPIKGDPEQLKRALINLLDNAVEAIPPDGRDAVTVEASFDAARRVVRIEVRDTGRGIRAEEREKLFLPYFSTKAKGMGLGLAIVSRIVSDHGGRIGVSDNAPRGSVFTVEIPT